MLTLVRLLRKFQAGCSFIINQHPLKAPSDKPKTFIPNPTRFPFHTDIEIRYSRKPLPVIIVYKEFISTVLLHHRLLASFDSSYGSRIRTTACHIQRASFGQYRPDTLSRCLFVIKCFTALWYILSITERNQQPYGLLLSRNLFTLRTTT